MKPTRHALSTLILSALLISPGLTQAEESLWDKAKQATSKGWEVTQKGAEEAAEWGKERSVEAWDATKEGAAEASEWSKEKAAEAWDAARKGTAGALDALKGESQKSAEEVQRDRRVF